MGQLKDRIKPKDPFMPTIEFKNDDNLNQTQSTEKEKHCFVLDCEHNVGNTCGKTNKQLNEDIANKKDCADYSNKEKAIEKIMDGQPISFRLPKKIYKLLNLKSDAEGRTKTSILNEIIEKALLKEEDKILNEYRKSNEI